MKVTSGGVGAQSSYIPFLSLLHCNFASLCIFPTSLVQTASKDYRQALTMKRKNDSISIGMRCMLYEYLCAIAVCALHAPMCEYASVMHEYVLM